jgi:hypothetical protein
MTDNPEEFDPDEFDPNDFGDAVAHWKASRGPRDIVGPKAPTLADSVELHNVAHSQDRFTVTKKTPG